MPRLSGNPGRTIAGIGAGHGKPETHRDAHKRSRKAEVEAMRAAAKELDAMIAEWGASEDELRQEYKKIPSFSVQFSLN